MRDWTRHLAALEGPLRADVEYLLGTLPLSDTDTYPFSLFAEFARHARMLRDAMPWCAALDEHLYLDYVLCPRVNDEDLSLHRPLFFQQLLPRVQGLGIEQAVLAVNRWCNENVAYRQQDTRTASPLSVYRNGFGRCGEESAFLVAALRSIGIAARQVYAERWSHCDDNHAWVEAWCAGSWRFVGACEPEPEPDRGWFNAAAGRAMLIHSRRFGCDRRSPSDGEALGRIGVAAHHNQTDRYAATQLYTFRVLRDSEPAAGIPLRLQILNEARFHTVITLQTNSEGIAAVRLGIGDLWLSVGDRIPVETLFCGGEQSSAALELTALPPAQNRWRNFDFHAPSPVPTNLPALTDRQKELREDTLSQCRALREARGRRFFRRSHTAFPEQQDLLEAARGNAREIAAFLGRDSNPLRTRLLRSLREKDLRDITADILEDHLAGAAPYANSFPPRLFDEALLCPRVADEMLTAWRRPLREALDTPELADCASAPQTLWRRLTQQIRKMYRHIHPTLYWPPDAALQSGRCDARSLRVLYIALLRAGGVPARLNPVDGVPEYWRDEKFHSVDPRQMGTLILHRQAGQSFWYGRNWSLSMLEAGEWLALRLPDDGWQGTSCAVELPVGQYRLLTSTRLPNGDQLAAHFDFPLESGTPREIDLRLRSYELTEHLVHIPLPPFSATFPDGVAFSSTSIPRGRCALLLWLDEGAEPTEHVLNELTENWQELCALPLELYLLLRSEQSIQFPAIAALLHNRPAIHVLCGEWEYNLGLLARQLYCDPDTPPLCTLLDQTGSAIFAHSGYQVGLIPLLIRITRQL